jgi:hypothetical protein
LKFASESRATSQSDPGQIDESSSDRADVERFLLFRQQSINTRRHRPAPILGLCAVTQASQMESTLQG